MIPKFKIRISEFYQYKTSILLNDVHTTKLLLSNKLSFDAKKFKYFRIF